MKPLTIIQRKDNAEHRAALQRFWTLRPQVSPIHVNPGTHNPHFIRPTTRAMQQIREERRAS